MNIKRSLFTATLMLSTLISSAQNLYVHNPDDFMACHQSYHSVLTSDGCMIIDEDIFDDTDNDIGIKFLKIHPQDGFVDSLYVSIDSIIISTNSIFDRNPMAPNENIYLYFSNKNGVNYYNMLTFSDNMEITATEQNPIPIEGDMMRIRYHLESSGDFIASWDDSTDNTCIRRFARFGIDGTLKTMSEPIEVTGNVPVRKPFFIIENEPLKIGFLTYEKISTYYNNGIVATESKGLYVYTLDENLQLEQVKFIKNSMLAGFTIRSNNNSNSAIGFGDGCFAIMVYGKATNNYNYNNTYHLVFKFDRDLNLVGCHWFSYPCMNIVSAFPMAYDANNGRLYVIGYDDSQYEYLITHVRCLDVNSYMNLLWDRAFLEAGFTSIYTVRIMDDNTLAFSGYMSYIDDNYYDSHAFASFVDEWDDVVENMTPESPFFCYPNPVKDFVSIDLAEDMDCRWAEIYNVDGLLIQSQSFGNGTIDVSGLNAGVYVMKLRMADGSEFLQRIVKL